MRIAEYVICLLILLFGVELISAADQDAETKPVSPRFVVYASEADAKLGSSLFRVLRTKGERARFDKAETIEQAVESAADVLVLVIPTRELPKLETGTLESLKKRKIVGIGYGAAQLFGQLGLEINGGACAHGVSGPPGLVISVSELLGEPKNTEPVLVLQNWPVAEPGDAKLDLFAVFQPRRGSNATVIDVIARWSNDLNYAPIVRQGNCVLIGIPAPATEWTVAYSDLIRETCLALLKRKLETHSTAHREVTKPGTYEFKLAESGNTDLPFERSYYFQFTEATRFCVQLEHAGSDSVMMSFMGQDEDRTHWTRQDARQGDTLKIIADINQVDVKQLGDRYWILNVTNFGAPVECKLTITIDEPQ